MNKKPHFVGHQAKTWTDILAHELFTTIGDDIAGQHGYEWILSNEEKSKLSEEKQADLATETLHKIYQIFVARSSALFSQDHILL